MRNGADRNKQAALAHEEARIAELQAYMGLSDEDLDAALDTAQMHMDTQVRPALKDAEDWVAEQEDLQKVTMAITPEMQDNLQAAREQWAATKAVHEAQVALLLDLEQMAFARTQAWEISA